MTERKNFDGHEQAIFWSSCFLLVSWAETDIRECWLCLTSADLLSTDHWWPTSAALPSSSLQNRPWLIHLFSCEYRHKSCHRTTALPSWSYSGWWSLILGCNATLESMNTTHPEAVNAAVYQFQTRPLGLLLHLFSIATSRISSPSYADCRGLIDDVTWHMLPPNNHLFVDSAVNRLSPTIHRTIQSALTSAIWRALFKQLALPALHLLR